ncbi:MAG: PhnD/SsuA/transferrin family substrate-binding protein [Rhodobacterales bacterium]
MATTSPLSMAKADITLTFGTYAADKPTATIRKFKPFLDYLGREMSTYLQEPVTIKIRLAGNYDLGIADLTKGRVDFSRFGSASYVTAKRDNPGLKIIAMESKKGKKTFKGIIAVHEGSDIKTLKDLKGRSFAFGDPLSTIGRYLAQAHLLDAGVTGSDLKYFAYLGRHDRVGAAVGNGDFDAGALEEGTFKQLQAKGTPIVALMSFNNVTKPWISRSELPLRIFKALNMVMLNATGSKALKNTSKSGFLPGEDHDYDSVRVAMKRSVKFN